ncbi:glycosyltransferase [Priestia flexa]|uniref:glycosyltransferase n=1 Tax=Priestia flexa TaxID=86664 RepID=UPI000C246358|nr:glycosyltransferase [Priestia flexa]MEC0666412.1 glycosyltransferase [Priestia flexa]
MEKYSPVILFVYNRPELTLRTINSLKENMLAKFSDLIIYSDCHKNKEDKKNVKKVREIIKNINGFKSVQVIEANVNKGLANSVIEGVTEVINKYGKAIVLEDDLLTSPYFLSYMNLSLNHYQSNQKIWSISGYSPIKVDDIINGKDVYFTGRGCSWGWATWKDRWLSISWNIDDNESIFRNKQQQQQFNEYGNDLSPMLHDYKNKYIDSWAIRWCYNQFLSESLTVYPSESLVFNIGLTDESSTHGSLKIDQLDLSNKNQFKYCNVYYNKDVANRFSKYYSLKLHNYIGFFLKRMGVYKQVKYKFKKLLNNN